jgi:hypothetical protein
VGSLAFAENTLPQLGAYLFAQQTLPNIGGFDAGLGTSLGTDELRLIAAVRRTAAEVGAPMPRIGPVDELLDE